MWVSAKEAAANAAVTIKTIYEWVRLERIVCKRIPALRVALDSDGHPRPVECADAPSRRIRPRQHQ